MPTISEYEAELKDIRKQYNKISSGFEKKIGALCKTLTSLYEERDTEVLATSTYPDIALMLTGNTSSMAQHNARSKQLDQLGLRHNGYFSETGQTALQICLYKDDDAVTTKTLEALEFLMPHIVPLEKVGIILSIFEHTFSEWGIYELHIKSTGTVKLVKTTYGRPETLKTFSTLLGALKYCQKHHYYKEDNKEHSQCQSTDS